jgi:hypothetical protein
MTESCRNCRFSRRRTVAHDKWLMCCRRVPAAVNTAQTVIPELLRALALVIGRREDLEENEVLSISDGITLANWPAVEATDWCGEFEDQSV